MPAVDKNTAGEPSSRNWEALQPSLSAWILDAVHSLGFSRMTPVQRSTIPLFLGNKDVVVVTGSGKTLSFLIPVVERLLRLDESVKRHHVAAIIVSPTRELATQIHGVLQSLLGFHEPSAAAMASVDEAAPQLHSPSTFKILPQLLVGGVTTPAQDLSSFLKQSPNILISTPGRLLELLSSPHVHCPQSSFEVLVLDEADRLLDLGFKEDLQKILSRLPKQRRTGLFSASVSEAVDQIVRVGLRNPVRIAVKVKGSAGREDQRTPASLQMRYAVMPASHKLTALSKLLRSLLPTPGKTIVYLSTCAAVDYFQRLLPHIFSQPDQHFEVVPLHGQYEAKVRQKNFNLFVNAISPCVLLTTDVAARGLDIPQVDLVVQVDPPSDPKVFIHRCGRAGRAGRSGLSVVFLQPGHEEDYVSFLEVRKTPISPLVTPNIMITDEEADTTASRLRRVVLQDRAIHVLAQRAFPSWMKSYTKHQACSIFRVADLEWEDLAKGWALLKLPKMPELKTWEGDRSLGLGIDFDAYEYKDKKREELRRQALVEKENGGEGSAARVSKRSLEQRPWSQKLDDEDLRRKRRMKNQVKKEKQRIGKMTTEEKEQDRELNELIQEVRCRNLNEEDFEGFGD